MTIGLNCYFLHPAQNSTKGIKTTSKAQQVRSSGHAHHLAALTGAFLSFQADLNGKVIIFYLDQTI